MAYIEKFVSAYKPHPEASTGKVPRISTHIIDLAERITAWHAERPAPDRWHPLQLGRAAATFGASRETMASALHYAGWRETKHGAHSLWVAPTT